MTTMEMALAAATAGLGLLATVLGLRLRGKAPPDGAGLRGVGRDTRQTTRRP